MARQTILRLVYAAWLCACMASQALGEPLPDADARGEANPFAGFRVIEVAYLLEAPDGTRLRMIRTPDAPEYALRGMKPGSAEAQLSPVIGGRGWSGGWPFSAPRLYSSVGDYVREIWSVIVRLLDYLGVVVLIAGSWVIWFLVRPTMLGLSDRVVFLLVFSFVCGLWVYATELYASVLYALGLMFLPALILGLLGWITRRLWHAVRGQDPAPSPGP